MPHKAKEAWNAVSALYARLAQKTKDGIVMLDDHPALARAFRRYWNARRQLIRLQVQS